uniref:Putative riboflavin biosynthesis protein RibA n=1 Tax=uncultured bacterium CBNPD1 BAC clone 2089 TaxID=417311 RepID=B1N6R3_9BACT|nr:putative riboflavin biosynthesis protein RibA [uncultured bacterium CBNPD1 BAC clone 2089]
MSDWNPLDPDAESVHYDLGAWNLDQRAAVAEVFAEAEIPHAWVGDEVVVPAELEEVADVLLDRLEQEFGVDGATVSTRGASFAIDEADDDDITEYELDDWADNERARLSELLVASGIPFKWEGALLVTLTDFEDTVDELLDAVEAGDVTIVDSSGSGRGTVSVADSDVSGETLTQMFLAAERLQRDPLDADGLALLVRVLDDVEDGGTPFGVPVPAWRQALELADQLADALAGGDIPDEIGAMEVAQRLFVTLRPHV